MAQMVLKNNIFVLLVLFVCGISAEPIITPFNYSTDMPQVEALIKKEWSHLFWMPHYDAGLIDIIFRTQRPGNSLARNHSLIINVLKENSTIIGFITYYQSEKDTGDIELLAIDSAYQGLGYGKKLMNYVYNWFKKIGCKYIQLYVYTSNNQAIQFYKHLGFVVKKSFPTHLLLAKQIA
jgi:ribosomal protein S18 acetylase RimI-like enzyme